MQASPRSACGVAPLQRRTLLSASARPAPARCDRAVHELLDAADAALRAAGLGEAKSPPVASFLDSTQWPVAFAHVLASHAADAAVGRSFARATTAVSTLAAQYASFPTEALAAMKGIGNTQTDPREHALAIAVKIDGAFDRFNARADVRRTREATLESLASLAADAPDLGRALESAIERPGHPVTTLESDSAIGADAGASIARFATRDAPRAVVVIEPGFVIRPTMFHLGAARSIVEQFVNRGIEVQLIDRSVGDDAKNVDAQCARISRVVASAGERHPDVPVYLLGHEFGGSLCLRTSTTTDAVAGIVLLHTSRGSMRERGSFYQWLRELAACGLVDALGGLSGAMHAAAHRAAMPMQAWLEPFFGMSADGDTIDWLGRFEEARRFPAPIGAELFADLVDVFCADDPLGSNRCTQTNEHGADILEICPRVDEPERSRRATSPVADQVEPRHRTTEYRGLPYGIFIEQAVQQETVERIVEWMTNRPNRRETQEHSCLPNH